MANINQKEPVYSGTQINSLVMDIESKAREEKFRYPVVIQDDKTGYGRSEVAVINKEAQKIKETKNINVDLGTIKFVCPLRTIEFLGLDGTNQKIVLPNGENVPNDPVKLLRAIADIMEGAEALRKYCNLTLMTNKQMSSISSPSTGVLLADKLTDHQGVTVQAEQEIRMMLGGVNAPLAQVNAMLKQHDANRVVMSMKDKYLSACNRQYVDVIRLFADTLEKAGKTAPVTNIETTGAAPTVVNDINPVVQEVLLQTPKKDDGFKSIL